MAARQRPAPSTGPGPAPREQWSVAVVGDSARLDIPADAQRERRFEIYCCFTVAHPGSGEAWHALRVLVDGRQEWARRISTDSGGRDTLELRLHRSVPAGRALRLAARGATGRARPVRLSIVAEEE